jgi:hypothetical protein
MTDSKWAVFYDISGRGYGIGPIPQKKRVALYYRSPTYVEPIAYFHDEDDALQFLTWLESFADRRVHSADGCDR